METSIAVLFKRFDPPTWRAIASAIGSPESPAGARGKAGRLARRPPALDRLLSLPALLRRRQARRVRRRPPPLAHLARSHRGLPPFNPRWRAGCERVSVARPGPR